ncbi:MAG: phosphoenolpyruvate carboxykinase (ATP), partial [Planctomycetota bacterium]
MGYREDLQRLFGLSSVDYHVDLSKDALFDEALAHDRGRVAPDGPDDQPKAYRTAMGKRGPLLFLTDPSCTGRPVQDTFGVAWPELEGKVWWKNDFQRFDPDHFAPLLERVGKHLNERGARLYVMDVFAGSDPDYAVPYRFVGEYASHAFFVHNMFPKGVAGVADEDGKRWTLLNVPSFHADPERDGTRSKRAVIMDFKNQICLVIGRADYCGVNKKTMFTVMNYLLPELGHMSMHCSANVGARGDGAILFGLSGTGKTTLSADPDRQLVGDDETAWTTKGISNLEDGCYAKLIDLNKQAEPIIAAALSMPGTLIENVPTLPGKSYAETDPQDFDLSDRSITENTRFSYPLSANPNVAEGARGPHPETIVLLTADAFGVLPPVSILETKEVMYHFIQGFTAKLAGTEVGITEPKAAFSSCFGAPFMAQMPSVYAKGLAGK